MPFKILKNGKFFYVALNMNLLKLLASLQASKHL